MNVYCISAMRSADQRERKADINQVVRCKSLICSSRSGCKQPLLPITARRAVIEHALFIT